MKQRILICDDQVMFSDMLGEFLSTRGGFEVVHRQSRTDNLLEALNTHNPDLLLSDLYLPGPDLFEVLAGVLAARPGQKVMVMSGMLNDINSARLYKLGVHGIASKTGTVEEILKGVEAVLAGRSHYPEAFLAKLQGGPESAPPEISKREVEVMALVANGLSEKEIAAKLGLSEKTVNNHKRNIFAKLGVQNQVAMVVEGIRLGLIPNPSAMPEEP